MPKINKESIPSGNLITNFFTQEFEVRSLEQINARETFSVRSETAAEIAAMRDQRINNNATGAASDEFLFFNEKYFKSAINYYSFLASNHYVIPTGDATAAEKIITPGLISIDIGLSTRSISNLRPSVELTIMNYLDTEETLYNILFTSRFGNSFSDRVTSHHELMYPKGVPGTNLDWEACETALPPLRGVQSLYNFEAPPVQATGESDDDFAERQARAMTFSKFEAAMQEAGKPNSPPLSEEWIQWLNGTDASGNHNFKLDEWYASLSNHFQIPEEFEKRGSQSISQNVRIPS
jgi:hypothetical protein